MRRKLFNLNYNFECDWLILTTTSNEIGRFKLQLGLLNCPMTIYPITNCLKTNCPITTRQVN